MRTTVTVDDHLLERAKARAREQHRTLGDVVETALHHYLALSPAPDGPPLPVFAGDTGFAPGVDPSSNASMFEAADAEPAR